MTVATFVIAVLGWVTATASFTWNIISWLFSAGRAKVELRVGAVVGLNYMTSPIQPGWAQKVQQNLERNGLDGELAFFITVRNKGRIAITVEGCSFRAGNGMEAGTIGRPDWGKAFPARIEAGGAPETFAYRTNHVHDLAEWVRAAPPKPRTGGLASATVPDPRIISAVVQLGNGKKVRAKPGLPI